MATYKFFVLVSVGALRLLEINVPSYLKKGESTRLECRYDLDSDKFYSVTWYKDNEHIFSISRKTNKKQVFLTDGVRIDQHRSNNQILQLQSVDLNSTGYYMCEVNADNPPFKAVKGEAYMEIIDPPREDPKITGEEEIYASGDILALNCTSAFSHPAARLQWFINDSPIEPDSEVLHTTSHGLHSTLSNLRLELNPVHVSEGKIQVKCQSTVRSSLLVKKKPYYDVRSTVIYVRGFADVTIPSAALLICNLLLHPLLRK
uniref:Ig-like domain-containing protein n=1 Tax=Trichogramma kaykai TaxID=54128 RepID=A0ABD2WR21_9HYME